MMSYDEATESLRDLTDREAVMALFYLCGRLPKTQECLEAIENSIEIQLERRRAQKNPAESVPA